MIVIINRALCLLFVNITLACNFAWLSYGWRSVWWVFGSPTHQDPPIESTMYCYCTGLDVKRRY
jgi:hypothetical protein